MNMLPAFRQNGFAPWRDSSMSSSIWTRCAGDSELKPLRLQPWRAVEAQHQLSTRKLVDSAEEQTLLEELIDGAKPPETFGGKFHYLLSTPFRYPPLPHGSRFGTLTNAASGTDRKRSGRCSPKSRTIDSYSLKARAPISANDHAAQCIHCSCALFEQHRSRRSAVRSAPQNHRIAKSIHRNTIAWRSNARWGRRAVSLSLRTRSTWHQYRSIYADGVWVGKTPWV